MAMAQGPTGCPICRPTDVEEEGVAPRVSKVLDPTGAFGEVDWASGVPGYWYDSTTGTWTFQRGATDPAQVINYSRGADVGVDDTLNAQIWDASVDTYGVTATVAAGNSGPTPRSVNDPALAYNVIGVGAFSGGGTTDPSDDSIFAWSSRGPTVGGRKKPDLVAVGDGGLADSYYESTGQLWKYDTGTSYAAPQVGAGAILLAGAGIRDPKVVKAILIDSARPGRATPAAAMGTQVGWLPDWGWGEMNLDAAFHERLNFARDSVPRGGARFFRASTQLAGDRATLAWNRRVADCQPLRQGCYYDTDSGFRVYTLSNLDLAEYDAASGVQLDASTSAVDNVEQVRAAGAGNVVYKVTAGDVDGPAGEPFALAATRPITPLATPEPTTSVTVDASGPQRAGDPVRVVAEVANRSADLTAENTQVTLALPEGVEMVAGDQTQPVGTLQTRGAPSDRATASWTVRGTTDGIKQLIASTSASRYGSTFRSSAATSFGVDAAPPIVTLAAPTASPTNGAITIAWGASDQGAGVAAYDVEVAKDGEDFSPWLSATTQTAATYLAATGHRYRFRVRATDALGNISDYVVSPEVDVPNATDDPAANPGGDGPPDVDQHRPLSPELKIMRVRRSGSRLLVRGTVARGANGRITAMWSARRRGRATGARASTYAQLGTFALGVKIPRTARRARRARLTVTYAGGHHFAKQTRHLTLRSR
jgi:hypothetical protein